MFGFSQPGASMNPMQALILQMMQNGQGGGTPLSSGSTPGGMGQTGGAIGGASGSPLSYMIGTGGSVGTPRQPVPASPAPTPGAQQQTQSQNIAGGMQGINQGLAGLMSALKPQNGSDPFNAIPQQPGGALGAASAGMGGAPGTGMPSSFGGWASPMTQTLPNASVSPAGSLSMPAPMSMAGANPSLIQSLLARLGMNGATPQ